MAVSVENLEGLERKIVLSLPWSEIRTQVAARLKNAQKRARIDGFRPGKAPMKMIEGMYGPAIQDEVLNDAAVTEFYRIAAEDKLKVAGLQALTAENEQSDENVLKVAAVFETFPEITVGDLSACEIERVTAEVGAEDVEKTIEILRKQRTRYEYVERAAQNGDRVIIDFAGKIDGEAFEGGSAENYPFMLGEGRMLPEFEAGVVGMKEGESKDVSVVFPADYHGADVAGKTAVFTITLKNVAEAQLPEVNEEFARALGITDGDVSKMREEIHKNISREIKRRVDDMTKENVMQALRATTPVQVPKALLTQEVERLRREMTENFAAQGLDTKNMGELPDTLFTERAEQRVALGLILSELVAQHDLQANDEQIREVVAGFAESYEDPQEVIDWYMNDQERVQGPASLATEANVVAFILSKAKVNDKNMSFDDVMASAPQA
ncbi:MAG: trigger factor [Neisseria sp.]|nr:trigger factor [Neisseria sp.]